LHFSASSFAKAAAGQVATQGLNRFHWLEKADEKAPALGNCKGCRFCRLPNLWKI